MARIRNIKPGFFANEDLSEVDHTARLLFIGLWTLADARGVLEHRAKRIKAQIFPYDDITISQIEEKIDDLKKEKFLVLYDTGIKQGSDESNTSLIFIPNFLKHQYISSNEADSEFPLPKGYKIEIIDGDSKKSKRAIIQVQDSSDTNPVDIGHRTVDDGQKTTVLDRVNYEKENLPIQKPDEVWSLFAGKTPQDPNFPESEGNQGVSNDAGEICKYLKKHWKSAETKRKNYAHVTALLSECSKEQIIEAIENSIKSFDAENKAREMRPAFKDFLSDASDVVDMAKSVSQSKFDPFDGLPESIDPGHWEKSEYWLDEHNPLYDLKGKRREIDSSGKPFGGDVPGVY